MRFGLVKHWPRTLRFQLTFWNTVVILVLTAGALWGVREGVRWTLLGDLDNLLAHDIKFVQLTIDELGPDWKKKLAAELEPRVDSNKDRGWFVRVFAHSGELLWTSDDAPEFDVPTAQTVMPGAYNRVNYRLLQRSIPANQQIPALIVRVGVRRDRVEGDVRRVTEWLLWVFVLILAAAPLSGYWLAGRATRPLATILQTTARVYPDKLSERLPLRGSGDELDQLSATLNVMLDRLAAHLEQQRTFVANAAHELRSPLAAMRTALEVALQRDRNSAEYRELLADVIEECIGLGNLINHLLLLAEGDAGMLHADGQVRLDELVRRSVDMFQGIAEQRGVKLQAQTAQNILIRGNRVHLREVLHNLIDNALKYTPSGGSVDVELTTPAQESVQLCVRDSGEGIADTDLPNVFARFYRADKSRQRAVPINGHGLGLSICQAIVRSYDGKIAIASTLGKGTTVTVTLPAEQ